MLFFFVNVMNAISYLYRKTHTIVNLLISEGFMGLLRPNH